jgi:serine/threonine-protein kinase
MNSETTDRRARLRLGTILCRQWRLESILGCGETAVVYAAAALHRKRHPVAIRILHPELSADETVRSRFFGEAYTANQVEHPGAIPVLGHGLAEDGCAFLVMEAATAETLAERLSREPVPLDLALALADQFLDVLAGAHRRGIVHRHLEPGHILVAPDGSVRVLGFGGARVRELSQGSGREGSFRGAIGYAPPEQLRGRSHPRDPRSDVYASGALLYQMLSGRPVHSAANSTENIALTIAAQPRSLREAAPHVPARLAAVVDRALRYRPEERWPDAGTLQRALRAVSADLELPESRAAYAAGHRRSSSLAPWAVSKTSWTRPSDSRAMARHGSSWLRWTVLSLALVGWWALSRRSALDNGGLATASHFSHGSALSHDLPPTDRESDLPDGLSSPHGHLICDVRSATGPSRARAPDRRELRGPPP